MPDQLLRQTKLDPAEIEVAVDLVVKEHDTSSRGQYRLPDQRCGQSIKRHVASILDSQLSPTYLAVPTIEAQEAEHITLLVMEQVHQVLTCDILRGYAGQWLVLEGEEVIAHGDDPADLVSQARERGISSPYVFFVEPVIPGVVKIGL